MKFWILIVGFLYGNKSWALFNGVSKGSDAVTSSAETEALGHNLSVPFDGAQETLFIARGFIPNLSEPDRLKFLELLQQQNQQTEHLSALSGYHYPKQNLPPPKLHPNSKLLNESHFQQKNFQHFIRTPQGDLFNPEKENEKSEGLSKDHALNVFIRSIYKNAKKLLERNHQRSKSAISPASSQKGYIYPAAAEKGPEDYSNVMKNLSKNFIHVSYPEENENINSQNCQEDLKSNFLEAKKFHDAVLPITNDIQSMQNNFQTMQKNFQSEQRYLQSSLYGHQSILPPDQFGQFDEKRTKTNEQSHPRHQPTFSRGQSIQFGVPETHSNRQSIMSNNQSPKLSIQSGYNAQSLQTDDILPIEQSSYLHSRTEGQATQSRQQPIQSVLLEEQSAESNNQATPYDQPSIQYRVHDQSTQTGGQLFQHLHQSTQSGAQPIQFGQQLAQSNTTQSDDDPQSKDRLSQFNNHSINDPRFQSYNQSVLFEDQLKQFPDPSTQSLVTQLRKLIGKLLQNNDEGSVKQSIAASDQPVEFQEVLKRINLYKPKKIDDPQQDGPGAQAIFTNNLATLPSLLPSSIQPSYLPMAELNNVWKPIIKGQLKTTEAPSAQTPFMTLEVDQSGLKQQQQYHQLKDYRSQLFVPSTTVNSQQFLESLNTDYSVYPVHQPHLIYGAPRINK